MPFYFQNVDDEQWSRAMEYVDAVSELNYMTQIDIMMYDDPEKVLNTLSPPSYFLMLRTGYPSISCVYVDIFRAKTRRSASMSSFTSVQAHNTGRKGRNRASDIAHKSTRNRFL